MPTSSIRIDPGDLNRARVDGAVRLAFVGPVMLQLCIADKLPDALLEGSLDLVANSFDPVLLHLAILRLFIGLKSA